MKLIGLPNTYKFPDKPTGMCRCLIYGDEHCYHRVAEDTFVIFLKSHKPGFDSVCLSLTKEAFTEQYQEI